MNINELDGKYRVTTASDYEGLVPMQSDGITEIINGETFRTDAAGCVWNSRFTVLNDNEVKFESTADPSNAKPDFCLTKANGELTRDPITYTTIMKLARKGNLIRISGQVEFGRIHTIITMTRIE